jgi:uncharacterized protein
VTETTLLLGEVGSFAYGLDHAESDHDYLGVFAASTLDIAGLDWHSSKETHTNSSPGGDTDDTTLHELGKYLRLALKSNPTAIELLWLDTGVGAGWTQSTDIGDALVELRSSFLSEKYVRAAYRGYAFAQLQKFVAEERYKAKHAKHCLRIIEQGTAALETGQVIVAAQDLQRYHDLPDMTHEQVMELLKAKLDVFDEILVTPLRPEPDPGPARGLLRWARKLYI